MYERSADHRTYQEGQEVYGGERHWTMLTIRGLRYYLLTIIDYFSRYIIAWSIVKTVSQQEVKDLLFILNFDILK